VNWLSLSEIAALASGRLVGADAPVQAVTTDTRGIAAGQLFVALRGPKFDGHDFLAQAQAAQAAGALVAREAPVAMPQIVVPDTLAALQSLASGWREQLKLPLIALTGSNGKTTVKEMIANILACEGQVLATRGNLNNHIGVPLSLLAIRRQHAFAVIEMGANHPGEIARLTAIARPDIALITNAAAAHLEGFGSIAGVARAKGEIFQGLRAGGTAIINADDIYADYWRDLNRERRSLSFGLAGPADVRAREIAPALWRVTTPRGEVDIKLSLPGRHNVSNALAAAAVGVAAGVELDSIKAGLEAVKPVHGRLVPRAGAHGARLLDDTYNANPGSLAAAFDVLAAQPGEHWLILGDMAELGAHGAALHAQAGEAARAAGVTRLFALGNLSRAAVIAFGEGAEHFDSHKALADVVIRDLAAAPHGVNLLIKGSRSARMERVVEALVAGHGHTPGAEQGHAA
jgi:UDP-N-acetylmuramoyl-tripeptide--D-alanyl-D-alanine ligase